MTPKGPSHEPEKSPALPAKAAPADLGMLVDQLVKLGLEFAAETLPAILTRAVKEDLSTPALLEQLLRGELERREERRIRSRCGSRACRVARRWRTSTSRSSRRCSARSSRRWRPAPGCGRSRDC
ncbi:MAG: hypothetical protein ACM35G_14610 [Planctomycetaceae bacterium]